MEAVTLHEAEHNLGQLVERAIVDSEPTIIRTDSGGQVILVSLDEFNSWKETVYLLSDAANAAHLRKSLAEAVAGQVREHELGDA